MTTPPDDHEVAAAVAEGAGRLLVALRAERADLEGSDLKDLGDRSAHELIMGPARRAPARRRRPQ